jgi:AraC-like DNA-binding protein
VDYFRLIQNAIDRIEEHPDERVQICDLARAAYCSDAHFSRIFRAIVGLSVMAYVRCRRLSLAGRELTLTREKILDISFKYGYETPEAFAKAFKRFHGVTPIAARKNGTAKYLERSFPLVAKMKIMEGVRDMNQFGSPLQQILEDLGKQSANMYFCFNAGNGRYAIEATDIWSIMPPWDLYQNSEGKLWQFLWGNNRPVIQLNEMTGPDKIAEGKHNILQCRTKNAPKGGNASTVGECVFGFIIDGIPELKVVKSVAPAKDNERPFVSHIGQFEDEAIFIINTGELWRSQVHQLTDVFDKSDATVRYAPMEKGSPQKRLEYAAFKAEILARNASIEAANGGENHKGTMVVAFELHKHAMEIAKIAGDMRGD